MWNEKRKSSKRPERPGMKDTTTTDRKSAAVGREQGVKQYAITAAVELDRSLQGFHWTAQAKENRARSSLAAADAATTAERKNKNIGTQLASTMGFISPLFVLCGLLISEGSFAVGMGAVPWVLMSEVRS
ncbi:hypothetical protein V6N11_000932 [Hibiscus sabdariffa]|uniref:Uncharacterized protein n=1 Tax=Hibiscus sabdariffa TaxID=183260 RepID=A0ABR2RY70_9ROSI